MSTSDPGGLERQHGRQQARALARILEDAGLNRLEDVFGLRYGEGDTSELSLDFAPLLPHET